MSDNPSCPLETAMTPMEDATAKESTLQPVPEESNSSDDEVSEEIAEEEEGPTCISVEGEPTRFTSIAQYVRNRALEDALQEFRDGLASNSEFVPPRKQVCNNRNPHNILECSQIHSGDEVLRIGRHEFVRIRSLVPNLGYRRLLANPSEKGLIKCASTKEHQILDCKHLHIDDRCVPVGKERYGFLPEELIDNYAFRHLKEHPEHVGRWCTNTLKHEPVTCKFIHKAPRQGEQVGKKRNTNFSKDGKMVATAAKKIFEKEKRARNAFRNYDVAIPEFAKKEMELQRIVSAIESGAELTAAETAVEDAACLANEPKVVEAPLQEKGEEEKVVKNRRAGFFEKIHPALVVMMLAMCIALVVPVLFPE